MKVILTKQIKGLGKPGEVVDVSDGYAQNYLIPRNLAKVASAGAIKDIGHKKETADRREERELRDAKDLAAKLAENPIVVTGKAGDGGHLYGSITSKDIADATFKQTGIKVDRKKIELAEPIKSLGSYRVKAKLHTKVDAVLSVTVKEG